MRRLPAAQVKAANAQDTPERQMFLLAGPAIPIYLGIPIWMAPQTLKAATIGILAEEKARNR
jgi:hypothetical protein